MEQNDAVAFAEHLHTTLIEVQALSPATLDAAEEMIRTGLATAGLTLSTAVVGALAESCFPSSGTQ